MHSKTAVLLALLGGATAQQAAWGQCGGTGWGGPYTCVSGYTCQVQNEWYSQCVPGSGGSPPPSTPPPPPPPPTGGNTCGTAAINQLVGFGAGTTGGGSGNGVTVTNCSQFRSAVANRGVIRVSGILNGCGHVDILSDTSIIGVGANSGFSNSSLRIRRNNNVIIRNIRMKTPDSGGDLIELDTATRVWVDHCDLSNDGIVGDKDRYDGLFDMKAGSDLVTVSWTKLHDHWKGSLVGHSDNNGDQDRGKLRVTYHHNHFYNVNSRLPSMRFGTLHVYSSCYENNPASGVNSRMGAQTLVEQSHFVNTRRAIVTNLDSAQAGFATSRNNIFQNSDTAITQTSNFSPPYGYTTDPASCVCDLVKSRAGTGVIA
ncbi:pectin lyase-like protein [Sodiomyces alkalinus F11]|uniref:Pectin lyase-like protein n=1 Tax=Sodiomyces alkalinus (strain CBS 110278 / VKM F-3762 / F11) TaxID=1314773 RepID=A0A3N2PTZ7_SODAK|nr:pectin lyase-like protein [Sodiomyces alkalinus F11]ROT37980.1 pectin lyase-like protein [Sodiomyces alkalinus F11]